MMGTAPLLYTFGYVLFGALYAPNVALELMLTIPFGFMQKAYDAFVPPDQNSTKTKINEYVKEYYEEDKTLSSSAFKYIKEKIIEKEQDAQYECAQQIRQIHDLLTQKHNVPDELLTLETCVNQPKSYYWTKKFVNMDVSYLENNPDSQKAMTQGLKSLERFVKTKEKRGQPQCADNIRQILNIVTEKKPVPASLLELPDCKPPYENTN